MDMIDRIAKTDNIYDVKGYKVSFDSILETSDTLVCLDEITRYSPPKWKMLSCAFSRRLT